MWDALRSAHQVNNSFGEHVLADIVRIAGSTTIDGVNIETYFKRQLAYTSGRFKINFPNPGDISFYEQNSTTVLYVMHINAVERTRLP